MINLGDKVEDKVTGFTGIAVSRIEYLNGCIQYGVKGKVDKDGKMLDVEYIDEGQLKKFLNQPVEAVRKEKIGGIMPDAPKT